MSARRHRAALGDRLRHDMHSFVNIIATPKGGTHQQGFEQELTKSSRSSREECAKAQGRQRQAGEGRRARRADSRAHVSFLSRSSKGRRRRCSARPPCSQIVAKVVRESLAAAVRISTKRDDKNQVSMLLEKVVSEMKARISARAHKETQRRKNALESSSLPAKLIRLPLDRVSRHRDLHRRG